VARQADTESTQPFPRVTWTRERYDASALHMLSCERTPCCALQAGCQRRLPSLSESSGNEMATARQETGRQDRFHTAVAGPRHSAAPSVNVHSERCTSHSTTALSRCLALRSSWYSCSSSGPSRVSTLSSSGQTRARTCTREHEVSHAHGVCHRIDKKRPPSRTLALTSPRTADSFRSCVRSTCEALTSQ